jgi:two-component system CheB/CheR fusion protein
MSRILVVDDNPDAIEASAFLLRRWGHEVRSARDGESALRVARAWLPEVVLLDLGLPGIDGIQVAAALRQEPSLGMCRIVAMSALFRDGDEAQLEGLGVAQRLRKPLDSRTLRSLVGSAAGRSSPA